MTSSADREGAAPQAVTSIPGERYAAGIAMEMTAREFGGAIGIAALATILEAQAASFDAMMDVFVLTAVLSCVAALSALRLSPRAGEAGAPAPQSAVPAAEPTHG
jgi:hypothetical protein